MNSEDGVTGSICNVAGSATWADGACGNTNVRKSSGSTDDGGPEVIHQSIPVGLQVKGTSYGFGVFATRFFPQGSTVYMGQQLVIPNRYCEFRLVIDFPTKSEYLLNTDTHSVQFSETKRWLYLFDSFMNHSCEPTTISRQTAELRAANRYETVAVRDIHPGDQITCDYNLFEYDCHGKVIEECLCGSSKCIGRVAGFRYLATPEQQARIQLVDAEVLESMSLDPSNRFYYIPDLHCPLDRVSIDLCFGEVDSYRMVAVRDYNEGDVIYSNKSLIFPEDSAIVIEVNGKRKWLDNLIHTVNKGQGKREFYYFDSFQNHSCDANSGMVYHSEDEYDLIALKSVKKGDELTSDYEAFDAGLDGTSFHCKCGSEKCRGLVRA